MAGISIWSLLLIFAIVLLLFGTKKLKNIGGDLGGAIKNFKKSVNDDKSNKLCVALDFDGNKTATNGTFTVSFPSPATAADAIISMA